MKSSIDFLNEALKSYSGAEIARKVGAKSNGTVGNWKERKHLSPYYAAKVAELINEDPIKAMAIAGAEAEPDPEKRGYLLKKLIGVAASALIASVTIFVTPTSVEAAPVLKSGVDPIYIMLNKS